jgi:hypothetical protein
VNLWYLPYVREGFRPSGDGFSATVPWRPRTRLTTRLVAPGQQARDTATSFDLLGPGDVVGIDESQVLRVLPAPNSERAEPDFFPTVEFDAPDLPWAFSPTPPNANRVLPWMCLIVVEEQQGVSLRRGTTGQSRWILALDPAVAAHDLPVVSEAWAWAHAQVTCDTQAQIPETLANAPDRTISRLLSARRLLPDRRYLACVVPTYLAGVVAGLGEDPEALPPATARNPAWTATEFPAQLPVYYTWTFTTGEAGDVESMLRRLHPAPPPADARRPLNLRLASADAPVVVDWQPPLRRREQPTADPRPAEIVAGIRAALAPGAGDGPVVGPPFLGEPWVLGRPLDPINAWAPAVNLTPMARAAAGLGADLVRDQQEQMTAAVWDQFTAYQEADRQQRLQQLSTIAENQVKGRLEQAPIEQASRVLGPVVAQAEPDAPSVGLRTAVGRRTTNKIWRIRGRTVNDGQPELRRAPVATGTPGVPGGLTVRADRVARLPSPGTLVASGSPTAGGSRPATGARLPTAAVLTRFATVLSSVTTDTAGTPVVPAAEPEISEIGGTPPPLADTAAILAPGDTTYRGNRFAPRLATPLAEVLAPRLRGLLLPSTAEIGPDSLLGVDVDRRFVEAFLVGANQELNRELLWRGLPADPRATALRRFWNRTDGLDDIPSIADWPATAALGVNSAPAAAGILLRSEIVHRCPSLIVAAVPAVWGGDGRRRPSGDPGALTMPVIRTLVGDDLLYVGFAELTLTALIGGTDPSGPAGYFILLAENPVDPRFGLDPPITPPPAPSRGNISWSNVRMPAGTTYAPASGLPPIPAIGFSFATATGASVANVVQQRTFRAFLHASALVGRES